MPSGKLIPKESVDPQRRRLSFHNFNRHDLDEYRPMINSRNSNHGRNSIRMRRRCRSFSTAKRIYGMLSATNCEKKKRGRTQRLCRSLQNLGAMLPDLTVEASEATILSTACRHIQELRQQFAKLTQKLQLDKQSVPICLPKTDQHTETCKRYASVSVSYLQTCLHIRITCEKRPNLLVRLLETLENEGLNVTHANVNCNEGFMFDAVAIEHEQRVEPRDLRSIILQTVVCRDRE